MSLKCASVLHRCARPSTFLLCSNSFKSLCRAHPSVICDTVLPRTAAQAKFVDVAGDAYNKCNSVTADQGLSIVPSSASDIIEASDAQTFKEIAESFSVYENFITDAEEKSLFDEAEPYLRRLKYETSHWDEAIHGYREIEKRQWTALNQAIIERIRSLAFQHGESQNAFVHVLDVSASGEIRPHVDSVRFCGNTIAGVCLLSSAVMRLSLEKDKTRYADIMLKRKSLYIMQGQSRYDYAHEVFGGDKSVFRGQLIPRQRRISVICRNEPTGGGSEPSE